MSYERFKGFIVFVLVIYFLVGLYTNYFIEGMRGDIAEVYPFASWGLFQTVPNVRTKHTIRFLEVDGRRFDPPVFFADAHEIYNFRGRWPSDDEVRVFRLANSIERGDREEVRRLREEIERNFSLKDVVYEVVFVSYNPLEFWKNREVRELRVLERFTSGEYE